jgi:hypothetical protein
MPQALDYSDRQSKLVTRRILVEALHRLQPVEHLSNYAYVGFGAYQFLDFDLVHRHLGINQMTSIESDARLIARCHFNVPYRGIDIFEGTATTMIPTINWTKKAIVWLDYTQRLRTSEMADCENLGMRLVPGSVLAITLNCHPGEEGKRLDLLADALGSENVPLGLSEAKLGEWGLAKTQRELLNALMHRTLAGRGDGTTWQQLLNIRYRDDARMQLIVGIVDHPSLHDKIQACRFEDMPEVSFDAEAIVVEIPNLTLRERQAIAKRLPAKKLKAFAGLSEKDLNSYAEYYRWLDGVG